MLDPSEFWAVVGAICTGLITLSAVFKIITDAIKKLKEPVETQNQKFEQINSRIDKIEAHMDEHDKFFDNDKKHIEILEEGNRVTCTYVT